MAENVVQGTERTEIKPADIVYLLDTGEIGEALTFGRDGDGNPEVLVMFGEADACWMPLDKVGLKEAREPQAKDNVHTVDAEAARFIIDEIELLLEDQYGSEWDERLVTWYLQAAKVLRQLGALETAGAALALSNEVAKTLAESEAGDDD